MPAPETNYLTRKAVLWPKVSIDRNGRPLVGEPVEIDVRWNVKRLEDKGNLNTNIISEMFAVVDLTIPVHSKLWLGELEDWYETGSAGRNIGVMDVVLYEEYDDLKGREIRRVVGMNRFMDRIPYA